MKTRHVFSTPDLASARAAVDAARAAGIEMDDIMLIARSDVELESIPDSQKDADTDFMPAALRGAGYGGAAGLLAGLVAVVVTPIGLTLAGAAIATLAGAAIGTWSSALVGSSLPDPIRAKFDDEVKAGNILVVLDAELPLLDDAQESLERAGARPLPYESTSALS
ncbi:MAG: hypothetical protein M3Q40_01465 [Pseudomonadota bacterium]|nr:hypothetical protein [Pseudomonadota bacterium]